MRYQYLNRYPQVFAKMTGLRLDEFEELLADVLPRFGEAELAVGPARAANGRLAAGGAASWTDGTRCC